MITDSKMCTQRSRCAQTHSARYAHRGPDVHIHRQMYTERFRRKQTNVRCAHATPGVHTQLQMGRYSPDVCHMQHNKPRSAQRETPVRLHRARYTPDYRDVTAETCEREMLCCCVVYMVCASVGFVYIQGYRKRWMGFETAIT